MCASAEDGGDRPAHRRRGARLQQPAAGDRRQPADAGSKDVAGNPRARAAACRTRWRGVARGAKLAAQLLAFARRQPLEPRVDQSRPADPRHGRHAAPRARRGRRDRDRGRRRAVEHARRPGQVENALLNLAINARDAMDGARQADHRGRQRLPRRRLRRAARGGARRASM